MNILSSPGSPSPPLNPMVVAVSMDSINMTWSIPSFYCSMIDYYTVTVNSNSSYITNTTSILINGLQQGMNYTFNVKATDSVGREGNNSESVTILMDGEVLVYTLK